MIYIYSGQKEKKIKKDTMILADEMICTSDMLKKHLATIIELLNKLLESISKKEQ